MVLSSQLVKTDNFKSKHYIRLSYKNITNKQIKSIIFAWQLDYVQFDLGFSYFGGTTDDKPLGPGKLRTKKWYVFDDDSHPPKHVVKITLKRAFPYRITFDDGTRWTTKQHYPPLQEEYEKYR
jgi:hypothetical protein